MPNIPTKPSVRTGFVWRLLRWVVIGVVLVWALAAVVLVAARWIDPPTTAVHISAASRPGCTTSRIVNATNSFRSAKSRPTSARSDRRRGPRFYQHHGFDWHEIEKAAQEDLEGERTRGASTITQQLVKNLFFGTGRSFLRKGAEASLVPVAEFVLGKRRILEIYLNVVEWGPGVYGAESACRYHNETAARNIGRQQAARLAGILPAPLKRRPERMNKYSAIILERMSQMGW